MEVEIITTKRKLTPMIFNQLEEAKVSEMIALLQTPENILGYINPATARKNKVRVFLVKIEQGKYKVISNYNWEKSTIDATTAFGKFAGVVSTKKLFKDGESRDKFVEAFKAIKAIAMQKQIIIGA